MVSERQDLCQVVINEFLRAFRSLNIKQDYLKGEFLNTIAVKTSRIKLTIARHSSRKKRSCWHHLRVEKVMPLSRLDAILTFSMFID